MRTAVVAVALASVLQGCAADVWDRRVYACDEVERIDVQASSLEVGGEDDADDCFIEVKNLRNHELDNDVLSGNELEVYVSGPMAYDVQNTVLAHDADGLTIDGPRGDYAWRPNDRQLDATDVDDSGDPLFVSGPIRTIVLENAGDVELVPQSGFVVLEGDARRLDLQTKASFDRIDVDIVETADLTLPRGEVYELELDAPSIDIDPDIRTVEIDPTARVAVSAGGAIDIQGGAGTIRPGHVTITHESSIVGPVALVDIVNSDSDRSPRLESRRLRPSSNEPLEPGNAVYVAQLALDTTGDTGTQFLCEDGKEYDEGSLGDEMTYLFRIYDDDNRMLGCFAIGDDPEGLIDGTYGASRNTPESVNLNACFPLDNR
jgi:hypothetical protein